jgi:hypothetical protein
MIGCIRNVAQRGWFVVALVVMVGGSARAADVETRDFTVLISGKPSGEVHMTIHRQEDGSVVMRCDTDIKVAFGILHYKYVYRGLEVWKDRRLIRLDSNTDDNGKRFVVSAVPDGANLKMKVNNVEKQVRGDVWVTSYWTLPDPKIRAGQLTVLDADSGKMLDGKLGFIATEKLRVAGQEVTLNHYRFAGKVNVELWYDGSERLVRQEWTEQAHKTVLELLRVRR